MPVSRQVCEDQPIPSTSASANECQWTERSGGNRAPGGQRTDDHELQTDYAPDPDWVDCPRYSYRARNQLDWRFDIHTHWNGQRASATESAIKGNKVKELRLDPSITGNVRKVEDSIYSLRKLLPIDEVFKFIDDDLGEAAKLSADDRIAVRNGCELLIDNAITEVSVPTAQVQRGETVLGKIVASMRHQTTEYNSALEALRRAPEDQKLL